MILDLSRPPRPVLVAATDGVGTKLEVARLAGRLGTVGMLELTPAGAEAQIVV